MSQENVDVVRRQAEAYAVGDWRTALSFLDPDVVYDISRFSAAGTVFHGVQGVLDGFREWIGSWEGYRMEVLDVIDAGEDKVVVLNRQTGRGHGSGVPVEVDNAVVNTVLDGKVTRIDVYPSHADALDAVGLKERQR